MHHQIEVLQHKWLRALLQGKAPMGVGKSTYAQAVGRVKLAEQKFAAGIADAAKLQHAGGWQQFLDVICYRGVVIC